jgi:hypothetical protein
MSFGFKGIKTSSWLSVLRCRHYSLLFYHTRTPVVGSEGIPVCQHGALSQQGTALHTWGVPALVLSPVAWEVHVGTQTDLPLYSLRERFLPHHNRPRAVITQAVGWTNRGRLSARPRIIFATAFTLSPGTPQAPARCEPGVKRPDYDQVLYPVMRRRIHGVFTSLLYILTSNKIQQFTIIKIKESMLYEKLIAVNSENHTKP